MYFLPESCGECDGVDLVTTINFTKVTRTQCWGNDEKLVKFNVNKIPFKSSKRDIFIVGEPKFVLSINGGFNTEEIFTECQRKILKQMIFQLIEKNETYIIGTGLKVGIYKLFGEVVQHIRLLNFVKDFCMIGISSWKRLQNSESIVSKQTNYSENDEFLPGKFFLDSNCSLFLFNGAEHEKPYEDENSFRMSFEEDLKIFVNEKLKRYQSESFWLQIVYGGDEYNLDLAHRFLKNSDLILVIKGSGGIADLIAAAMTSESKDLESLCPKETLKTKDYIQDMRINYKNEIIIYDLDDTSIGIDEQISIAISLKEKNLHRKVLFSLIFNKVSIDESAFSKISDLNEIKQILKIFLKKNNFQILKTLFPKIENLEGIFQKKDLMDLYEESIKSEVGYQRYVDKKYNSLFSISKRPPGPSDTNVEEGSETLPLQAINTQTDDFKVKSNYVTLKGLFLWALRSDFHEMGRVIWENTDQPVSLAFCGAIELNGIANEYRKKGLTTLLDKYTKESEYYQNISKEVITEAYEKDNKVAVEMLLKPRSVLENKSLLQLVIREKFVSFCSQSACQDFLNNAWKNGNLSDADQKDKKITFTKFVQSPKSKFFLHLVSYIFFLVLFSYFNLVELDLFNIHNTKRVVCEFTIYVFILGFIFEEIQQTFYENHYGNSSKFYNYFKGLGNKFDVTTLLIAIVSFALRWTVSDDKFMIIRCFYAVTLSMFYAKTMFFYLYNPTFGHKVIMIKRMIMDTVFFLVIFLVFIFAYGTLLQSLQYPNSSFGLTLLKDVFYRPYFQVYGELMLDSFQIPEVCNTSSCIFRYSTMMIGFAVFLLLTNILLLNLLIAMFNYTFQQDVENRYSFLSVQLLQEYHNKSIFPSPFICLYFPVWFSWCFYRSFITGPVREEIEVDGSNPEREILPNPTDSMFESILLKRFNGNEMARISAFEKWCTNSVLRKRKSDWGKCQENRSSGLNWENHTLI